jgi:hypothetical protein
MEEEAGGSVQRLPWHVRALLLLLGCAVAVIIGLVGYFGGRDPPNFSVSVSSYEGLDVRSGDPAAVPPAFHVVLRVGNPLRRRRCFTQGSAAVNLDGVPLARADSLPGFCVPGQSVHEVPFVATGGWLGLPDQLYHDRVPTSVAVRVRLDGGNYWPVLLRCTATLDGRPSPNCPWFNMLERGIYHHPDAVGH